MKDRRLLFRTGTALLAAALLLTLLSACTGSNPGETVPPEDASSVSPGQGEQGGETAPSETGGPTDGENDAAPGEGEDPSAASGGEDTPPSGEGEELPPESGGESKAPYAADEIVPLFSVSEDTVLALYGEPETTEKVALYYEDSAVKYTFAGGSFFCFEYVSRLDGATLYEASVADDRLAAPRGIKIGDGLSAVIGKFPDVGDETLHTEEGENPYRLLYGEYIHMGDFGVVEYEDGVPARVLYANQGTAVSFELKDEKVVSVHYTIPMN